MWDVAAELRSAALEAHGVVTLARARTLGATPGLLARWHRTGRAVRLAPGTYLLADLLDDFSHVAAACAARPGAVASHRAAAWLLGLDGVDSHVVEVTVGDRHGPGLGVVHRSADLVAADVTAVDGIPCTNATRTLCDVGAVVGGDTVELMLESALRLRLTTVPRLEARLASLGRKGRAGPPRLRAALAARPPGAPATESYLETRYLQCLRAHGVPEPVRQHVVRDERGRFLARLDCAYPAARLFVELDGRGAHGRERFDRDRARQNDVVLLGWRPLRFTYRHVTEHPGTVAARTAEALRRFS